MQWTSTEVADIDSQRIMVISVNAHTSLRECEHELSFHQCFSGSFE